MPIEPIYILYNPPPPLFSNTLLFLPISIAITITSCRPCARAPRTASGEGNNKLTCFIYGANVNGATAERQSDTATQRRSDKTTGRVAVKIVLICWLRSDKKMYKLLSQWIGQGLDGHMGQSCCQFSRFMAKTAGS